jgi:hypothetical protein
VEYKKEEGYREGRKERAGCNTFFVEYSTVTLPRQYVIITSKIALFPLWSEYRSNCSSSRLGNIAFSLQRKLWPA